MMFVSCKVDFNSEFISQKWSEDVRSSHCMCSVKIGVLKSFEIFKIIWHIILIYLQITQMKINDWAFQLKICWNKQAQKVISTGTIHEQRFLPYFLTLWSYLNEILGNNLVLYSVAK